MKREIKIGYLMHILLVSFVLLTHNVIQGIADDGSKVFDSRPWFNQDLGKEL